MKAEELLKIYSSLDMKEKIKFEFLLSKENIYHTLQKEKMEKSIELFNELEETNQFDTSWLKENILGRI